MKHSFSSPYCADPENQVRVEDSRFLILPPDLVTEARALGAKTARTASGFFDVSPLITGPEELGALPRLKDAPLIRELLTKIQEQAPARHILLNVSAPYSLLSQISSSKLPAWLLRRPQEVHAALSMLTDELGGYILEAFRRGVKIVSLSDPYAQKSLLGEPCHRAFAADYQLRLLRRLSESAAFGLVHLCPFSFVPLEEYGLLSASKRTPADTNYEAALLDAANTAENLIFIGRQCPHTRHASQLYQIIIK